MTIEQVADVYNRAGTTATAEEVRAACAAMDDMSKRELLVLCERMGFAPARETWAGIKAKLARYITDRRGAALRSRLY